MMSDIKMCYFLFCSLIQTVIYFTYRQKLILMQCSQSLNLPALQQRMESNGLGSNQWSNQRGRGARD